MVKVNFNFLKKIGSRAKGWIVKRPRLKFVLSFLLVSLLTSLLVVGLYDRYYGASPISNRGRLLKKALAACTQAQTLSQTAVDWGNWPLGSNYGLEGQALGEVASSLENFSAYSSETGPSAAEVATAASWLKINYPDFFSAQEACTALAGEYQQKYAY
jgi:hypothetical protein